MNKISRFFGAVVLTGVLFSCVSRETKKADYRVIPLPQEIVTLPGEAFVLNGGTKILYPEGNEAMRKNAGFLAAYIEEITGKTLPVEARYFLDICGQKSGFLGKACGNRARFLSGGLSSFVFV